MKRLIAYMIDYTILSSIIILGRDITLQILDDNIHMAIVLAGLVMYLYFWMNDVFFCGGSIGKRICRLNVVLKKQSIWKVATIHSLLKLAFTCVGSITFFMYIVWHCKMPYDKYFYTMIE